MSIQEANFNIISKIDHEVVEGIIGAQLTGFIDSEKMIILGGTEVYLETKLPFSSTLLAPMPQPQQQQ